ncbi:MAG: patatin-like phospholipase family protein [Leptothrix sp. (in: b-proteobacteria)]
MNTADNSGTTSGAAVHLYAPTPRPDQPRRALILPGGGLRLSYQAGILLALQQAGLSFQYFDGTSGGGLNLAMLLCGQSPTEICRRWRSMNLAQTISFLPLKDYMRAGQLEALTSSDGFRENIFPHLGINFEQMRTADAQAGFNVLDYGAKVVEVIPHQQMDEDLLVAGISLPGVFAPVRKNGKIYLDTGFVQDANLMQAVQQGAEELWVLWGLGNTGVYRGDPLHLYVQMLETSANAALNQQLGTIRDLNERIARGDSPWGQTRPIQVHLIRPDFPLPLDPELYLGQIDHSILIEMGYADARQYLRQLRADPPPPSAEQKTNPSRMNDPVPGIRLQLDFAGELNTLDTGTQHRFALDVCLHIPELEKFIAAPEHRARITGNLQCDLWGSDPVPVHRGVYLETTLDSDARRIVYEMVLEPAGRSITMVAEQILRDDAGMDLWTDLSHLTVRLYDGNAPWATGQLKLSTPSLKAWLNRIHATETRSTAEAVKTVAQYTKFFLGELNAVYGWGG